VPVAVRCRSPSHVDMSVPRDGMLKREYSPVRYFKEIVENLAVVAYKSASSRPATNTTCCREAEMPDGPLVRRLLPSASSSRSRTLHSGTCLRRTRQASRRCRVISQSISQLVIYASGPQQACMLVDVKQLPETPALAWSVSRASRISRYVRRRHATYYVL